MAQFDVFANPIVRARRAYPLVVVLQSDLADTGRERIVAPLALRTRVTGSAGRLMPYVKVSGVEHLVFVQYVSAVAVDDLRDLRGQLAPYREVIVAALDYLFLGV